MGQAKTKILNIQTKVKELSSFGGYKVVLRALGDSKPNYRAMSLKDMIIKTQYSIISKAKSNRTIDNGDIKDYCQN